MTISWCNRCKCKRNILNPEIKEVTSSRRGVMKFCVGNCESCGNRISVILPKEIITNNKIDKLQEEINLEKEKETKRMEEEKIQKQKEIDEQKLKKFFEESRENPIIQRNKDIIEVVDKTEKKVISKSYYTLFKIFLVLFGIIVLIFLYKTIYPEYFVPNYNSANNNVCNETLICGDNICSQPAHTCPACPSCSNECNVPDEIKIKLINGSG